MTNPYTEAMKSIPVGSPRELRIAAVVNEVNRVLGDTGSVEHVHIGDTEWLDVHVPGFNDSQCVWHAGRRNGELPTALDLLHEIAVLAAPWAAVAKRLERE